MNRLFEKVKNADKISIAGHIRPDGDCVGSCCALYQYLQQNYNTDGTKTIQVFMESVPAVFQFLQGTEDFTASAGQLSGTELFIALDSGSPDRLGAAEEYFNQAKETVCVDHHISNTGYAMECIVDANASSTCELLYELFAEDCFGKMQSGVQEELSSEAAKKLPGDGVSFLAAEPLYLGIVHDTGVFKHSNTSRRTMEIAGILLEKGVSSSKIIDGTFYEKTYLQNQILGRCLMESMLLLDGKIIVSVVSKKIQDFYQTKSSDFDGIIDNLRITKGVEVAILLIEEKPMQYKVSMRSNGVVDVSKIAVFFGGGGHVKASGCSVPGQMHDVINNLTIGIENQLLMSEKTTQE